MTDETLLWLESSWFGVVGRDSTWLFPALETLHFFGLCTLFGAMLIVDLRMLGYKRGTSFDSTFSYISIAIFGFSINLITGFWFLCIDPFRYYPNIAFRIKMVLIIIGGINALIFWAAEHKRLKTLPIDADAGSEAKVIAGLSLMFWILVIICGRMIPYVE